MLMPVHPQALIRYRQSITFAIMAELKKYTSFEALKLDENSAKVNRAKNNIFSQFEAFLKRLQREYSKKKTKTEKWKAL